MGEGHLRPKKSVPVARKKTTRAALEAAMVKLKAGEASREDVGLIADAINAKFSRLAELWAKEFTASASVKMFDNQENDYDNDFMITSLAFRRKDEGWTFAIDEEHCQDMDGESFSTIPFESAPLLDRVRAVDKIPLLRDALVKARKRQGEQLVEAFETISKFVEEEAKG